VDPQTNERIVVAEADVVSTLFKGNEYKGTTASTYEIISGSPVVAEAVSNTEYYAPDSTTVTTTVESKTKNSYGLVNNMVKILEASETSLIQQPLMDSTGEHATAKTMVTTYTYNEKGYLSQVIGKGTETGWEYSEEKSFNNPYTTQTTVSYEIKLDKPLETKIDEIKTYDEAAVAVNTITDTGSPITKTGNSDTNASGQQAADLSAYTSSEALLSEAWKYYNENDLENASLFLEEIVSRYADEAKAQQDELSDFAPKETAAQYWALNDVGTAEYLLGCIDQKTDYLKALGHFNIAINAYGFAQCWNSEGSGFFWHVIDAAQKEIATINRILSL
jgi:hypothetical protein